MSEKNKFSSKSVEDYIVGESKLQNKKNTDI